MLTPDGYREVYLAAPDGVLVVSRDGTIQDLNPAAEAIFGYTRDDLVGQPVERLVPEAFRSAHERHRARYVGNPHTRPMGAGLELEGRRRDGSRFPVEISLSTSNPGGADELVVVCTVRDVTERQRLRDFSRGALRSVEEERARIARELHDDPAQRLATLMLRLALVGEADDAERRALLIDAREDVVAAVEGIKRIARGLRPPELEDLGLVQALHAHFRMLRQASGFQVEADLEDVENVLDLDAKVALYRIIQEALNNVVRHAGVESASVTVRVTGRLLAARVEDGGCGLTESPGSGGTGMGLMGMQERAQMAGGRLSVTSRPGGGTSVEVQLPTVVEEPARV